MGRVTAPVIAGPCSSLPARVQVSARPPRSQSDRPWCRSPPHLAPDVLRRAAAELIRRAERVANIALASTRVAVPNPITWSGTFHSVGARLLRHHARDIGLDPAFTIHDREDSADLMNPVRHEHGLSAKGKRFPLNATCLSIYSRVVNAQAALATVLSKQFPWCTGWERELKDLFAAYVEAKQQQNVLDYDDLLLFWAEMMAHRTIAAAVADRFDHVLVDEYQDTNRLQAELLIR